MPLNLELNEKRFLKLLENLIGETRQLQNDPDNKLIPKENLAMQHVLNALQPYLIENGGCIVQEQYIYDKNKERGNLILGYLPPSWKVGDKAVSFIGCHFDVVPAIESDWDVPAFKLTSSETDPDRLNGRGTTDCLGHVALVTELFIQLAEKRPHFDRAIWGVMICSEEVDTPGIGIDQLQKEGKLDRCKYGPCYWLDSSERQACIGCGSTCSFNLIAHGMTAHSGMPNQGINSIELAHAALKFIQRKFYDGCPYTEKEEMYGFQCASSLKPTQLEKTSGSINQIPSTAQINGDIRLTPFYDIEEVKAKLLAYADQINEDPTILPSLGPSKYIITDDTGKIIKGRIELVFPDEPLIGIACKLDSEGFKYLDTAIKDVVGESKPYSVTGSLPLVGNLQAQGYDIQITGFGYDAYYHADNECCSKEWMKQGMRICSKILDNYILRPSSKSRCHKN